MSEDPLHYKSITEITGLFRRGAVKPSEVTEAMLNRIDKLDGEFHGYAVVLAERALAQAKRRDAEIAKGIWRGPLHGVPIGLKDLCYTTFAPTAGGTKFMRPLYLLSMRRSWIALSAPARSRSASSR